jgi:hypothetical protein
MVGRGLHRMMLFGMLLHPLQKMQGFMFFQNQTHVFPRLFFNFLLGESTLFYPLMAFAHWSMLSLLTPLK